MSLKAEFVKRAKRRDANMSALCREYSISRETGYKWLRRFQEEGPNGLDERSRRPHETPLGTAEEIVVAIVQERKRRPRWGPTKLRAMLVARFGEDAPSERTISRVLKRFGEIVKRRPKRVRHAPEGRPVAAAAEPNDLWTVDFKGHWLCRDNSRSEPLTVRDALNRFILSIQLVDQPSVEEVPHIFLDLFNRYGVPKAIQCDNGSPFISMVARGGLTRLSAWWVALGIRLVRSRVGCPQDNGAHERMHRDIAGELEAFPAKTRRAQQHRCDQWRQEFNHIRPHQALDGKVPAAIYQKSPRPPVVRRPSYLGCAVRRVSHTGSVRLNSDRAFLSGSLAGYVVGLQSLGGIKYRVRFYEYDLGILELVPFGAIVSPLERLKAPLLSIADAPLTPTDASPSVATSLGELNMKQGETRAAVPQGQ